LLDFFEEFFEVFIEDFSNGFFFERANRGFFGDFVEAFEFFQSHGDFVANDVLDGFIVKVNCVRNCFVALIFA